MRQAAWERRTRLLHRAVVSSGPSHALSPALPALLLQDPRRARELQGAATQVLGRRAEGLQLAERRSHVHNHCRHVLRLASPQLALLGPLTHRRQRRHAGEAEEFLQREAAVGPGPRRRGCQRRRGREAEGRQRGFLISQRCNTGCNLLNGLVPPAAARGASALLPSRRRHWGGNGRRRRGCSRRYQALCSVRRGLRRGGLLSPATAVQRRRGRDEAETAARRRGRG
mmetsp:Transcript_103423/g.322257  ORF Transcript_103423/g.322257 Transcript_103423/m.322257 type:complete len:227 (+) Transcript_103423:194-874(+)